MAEILSTCGQLNRIEVRYFSMARPNVTAINAPRAVVTATARMV
jgi:hypothetical protein